MGCSQIMLFSWITVLLYTTCIPEYFCNYGRGKEESGLLFMKSCIFGCERLTVGTSLFRPPSFWCNETLGEKL